eukprot:776283-Pelagomonas_calceolata.AAC.2
MEQARAAVWSQEASFLQMRCSMGMQALQARINPVSAFWGQVPLPDVQHDTPWARNLLLTCKAFVPVQALWFDTADTGHTRM